MFRSPTLETLTFWAYVLQNFKYVLSDRKYEGQDGYMMLNANRYKAGESARNGMLSPAARQLVNKMTYKVIEPRTDGNDVAAKAVTQVSIRYSSACPTVLYALSNKDLLCFPHACRSCTTRGRTRL